MWCELSGNDLSSSVSCRPPPAVETCTMWSKSPLRQRCLMAHSQARSDSSRPGRARTRHVYSHATRVFSPLKLIKGTTEGNARFLIVCERLKNRRVKAARGKYVCCWWGVKNILLHYYGPPPRLGPVHRHHEMTRVLRAGDGWVGEVGTEEEKKNRKTARA